MFVVAYGGLLLHVAPLHVAIGYALTHFKHPETRQLSFVVFGFLFPCVVNVFLQCQWYRIFGFVSLGSGSLGLGSPCSISVGVSILCVFSFIWGMSSWDSIDLKRPVLELCGIAHILLLRALSSFNYF